MYSKHYLVLRYLGMEPSSRGSYCVRQHKPGPSSMSLGRSLPTPTGKLSPCRPWLRWPVSCEPRPIAIIPLSKGR